MRPKLAEGTSEPLGRVLVLGHPGPARQIAASIRALGMEAEVAQDQGVALPHPLEPDAVKRLREALFQFVRKHPHSPTAVHPGTSVWAERPELPSIGKELGMTVWSVAPRILALFINKLNLLTEAERVSIPHLVQQFDPIHSVRELERQIEARKLRLPLVVKAVRSQGGFGIFVLRERADLKRRLPHWIEQLRRNLGEVIFVVERYVDGARHVTQSFARFADGRMEHFPLVDASLQRRHRKILELCPAPSVDADVQARLQDWCERLADAMGFVGVGQFEFLVDGPRAFLIDGCPRLSTGFHLWEKVAGTSAVEWQYATLMGGAPPSLQPEKEWAHAVSFRLYAEDSVLQLPQPGSVVEVSERTLWKLPGSRAELEWTLDPTRESKRELRWDDDALLGLLQVGAQDFGQSLTVGAQVLSDLWVGGTTQTNERFLRELVTHPWVTSGIFHAGFVEEEFVPRVSPPAEVVEAALFTLAQIKGARASGVREWLLIDRFVQLWRSDIRFIDGKDVRSGDGWFSGFVCVPGFSEQLRVGAYSLVPTGDQWRVRVGDWTLKLVAREAVGMSLQSKRIRPLRALVSGRVHALWFREGGQAPANDYLIVVESMGTLVPHAVAVPARIQKWCVQPDTLVSAGEVLAELELENGRPN